MQTTIQQAETGTSGASAENNAPQGADNAPLERELAQLIVEALNLETRTEEITANAPLYGEGLGLDSIDILEIALVVSKKYGFQLRSDDENNVKIFQSLGSLAAHIATHRTK
ncbi:MAG: phosphopantetheine-binding protein [Burkholderiaceae bacterium]